MITNIFFDFDGVIKDSVEVKSECFIELFKNEDKSFQDRIRAYHLNNGGISRYNKLRLWLSWLELDVTDDLVEIYADRFSRLVLDKVVCSSYVPGALEILRSNKVSKYLVTGTPTLEMKQILNRLNLEDVFKIVRGSEWSKVSSVEYILKKHNLQKEDCIFIGDALTDLNAARSQNIRFYLRRTHYNQELLPLMGKEDYSSDDLYLLNNLIESV